MATKKINADQAAANAALVAQYIGPARVIARKADQAEKIKGDTWSAFKDAARIGLNAGQDAGKCCTGLSLACASLDVPKGTVNAYLPILRKLYQSVVDGADRDEALSLSIADARARWQPKKEKAKPETPKETAEPLTAPESSGEGGEVMGTAEPTERQLLLTRISAIVSSMTDDDLRSLLGMLESDAAQAA